MNNAFPHYAQIEDATRIYKKQRRFDKLFARIIKVLIRHATRARGKKNLVAG
jgi:hypothetical protein